MISFTDTQLYTWLAGLMWPLARILGLIGTAPVFAQSVIPVPAKVGLGLAITLLLSPVLPAMPSVDPASAAGLLILAQQILIGMAMGFVMNLVFMSVDMAGSLMGLTMGLGFATFYDPQTQGQSNAINQILAIVITLIFLQTNGHLAVLSVLAESFQRLPVGVWPHQGVFWQAATWGKDIFSAGVQLSLPVVTALLITNLALGILTRAAPQLNLFGIGFPLTIGIGFMVLLLSMDYLQGPLQQQLTIGLDLMQRFTTP